MPKNDFVQITDLESLDRFLAEPRNGAVVILKHSNVCGLSDLAYAEMAQFGGPVGLVTVQTAREVSNEIEKRTGVEHESPQILIMHDGQVKWAASHRSITAVAVKAAMSELVNDENQKLDSKEGSDPG